MNGHYGLEGMKRHSFFIPIKMLNLNDYTNYNRTSKHKANTIKQETEAIIVAHAKKQLKWLEIYKPVLVVCTWSEANKMRDPDNICFAKKFILDALVKANVLANDGWGQIVGFNDRFKVDRQHIGVLVELYEVDTNDR